MGILQALAGLDEGKAMLSAAPFHAEGPHGCAPHTSEPLKDKNGPARLWRT